MGPHQAARLLSASPSACGMGPHPNEHPPTAARLDLGPRRCWHLAGSQVLQPGACCACAVHDDLGAAELHAIPVVCLHTAGWICATWALPTSHRRAPLDSGCCAACSTRQETVNMCGGSPNCRVCAMLQGLVGVHLLLTARHSRTAAFTHWNGMQSTCCDAGWLHSHQRGKSAALLLWQHAHQGIVCCDLKSAVLAGSTWLLCLNRPWRVGVFVADPQTLPTASAVLA